MTWLRRYAMPWPADPFGSNLTTDDFVSSGVPVIQGRNMSGRWLSGEFLHVSVAKAATLQANLDATRRIDAA